MPPGGTPKELAQSHRPVIKAGRAGTQRVHQATRNYPHIPAPQPAPKLTPQQLRRLSPTLASLHKLTSHDVMHSAAQSDEALVHAFQHLGVHTPDTSLSSSANERRLRSLASPKIPQLNPKKVGATLASGRQIVTTAPLAHVLGGLTDSNDTKRVRHQKRVLDALLRKPGKSQGEVRVIGELLREYHPKEYRNIQAAYLIHQQRQSGQEPKPVKGSAGIPTIKPTSKQRRRYLKSYEQTQQARRINALAERGKITHPAMPHGLVAFLGDLIPDTPAEIAAAVAGGYLVRGAGGALIRAGVKGAARGAAEGAASVAGKAGSKLAGAADRAILSVAARSPKADKALYGATRAAERSAPALRAGAKGARIAAKPISVPSGYAARHPGQGALGVVGGPPAVASVKQRSTNPLTAAAEGYYRALGNPKTYGTTARSIPGLITAPIGIAANVGKSIVTGNPKPAEQQAKDIADFGIGMARTFASGDPARIEKAIETQYGLTPLIMAGIPGSKLLARAGVNDAIGAVLRKVPGIRKGLEAQSTLRGHRADRLAVAKSIAYADNIAHGQIAGRTGRNAVPGLRTIVENLRKSDRHRTARDELRNRQDKITAEHLVKTIAEQGFKTRSDVTAFIKRHGNQRHPDAPANRITNYDVAQFLKDHPKAVEDPHIQAAVNEFKRMQKGQGYETSPFAKYLPMGITHGVTMPADRYVLERAALGSTEARAILAERLGISKKEAGDLAKAKHPQLAPKYKNKNPGGMEGTDRIALLRMIGDRHGRGGLSEKEFIADVKKVQQKKGLAEPAYTSDADIRARAEQGIAVGNRRGFSGRPSVNVSHQTRGILQQAGLADQSFESLVQHSIVFPRRSKAINAATAHLFEHQAREFPVGPKGKNVRILTERQAERAVKDGLIDPQNQLLLDSQNWKSAILDPRVSDAEKLGSLGTLRSLSNEAKQHFAVKKAGAKGMKGRTFVVVDRHVADEFLKQHFGVKDRTILQQSQHVASRAILGFSPSWLAAQPIAESAQGLAAVGAIDQLRGLYDYGKMSSEAKLGFDQALGTTSGTSEIQFHGSMLHQVDTPGKANRISRALEQTSTGRVVKAITTGRGASNIDRRKGLAIRRAVAAGHLTREYDKMTSGLGNLMGEADKLKGMTRPQVMEHFAKDPAARRKLESYVDDVMGNWQALTHAERKIAGMVIFYPFIRMSLQWVFHTYPSRHPFKASVMHFLAQENSNKLAQLTGGGPSFFPQWASAPLYNNQGKASQLIPLQRVAPGSNTLVEAIGQGGGTPLTNVAHALNPFVGAAASAFAGQDPLSGRSLVEHGATVPDSLKARLYAAQILNLPTPFRAVDSIAFGGKLTKKIEGKANTPTSQLYQKVGESVERKALRSFLLPLLPESTDKVALQAKIGRLLSDKYGKDPAKAARASAQLAALYSKFRVSPSASSSSGGFGSSSGGSF